MNYWSILIHVTEVHLSLEGAALSQLPYPGIRFIGSVRIQVAISWVEALQCSWKQEKIK